MRRLGLGIAVAVAITSIMPTRGMADDQQIADFIKSRLQMEQQQGNLRGFNVDMRVEDGTVWFNGYVSNKTQEMTILRTAQQAGHLGVVQVVDDIEVKSAAQSVMQPERIPERDQATYRRAAYQQSAQEYGLYQQASRQEVVQEAPAAAPLASDAVTSAPPMAAGYVGAPPMAQGYVGGAGCGAGSVSGPAPAPMAGGYGAAMPAEAPNLPGYAWPGYAAHPNYGALTYPKQYSASAWPYIGPFYPYPQVPLGWRKVTLEWDDGWWMLDFHDK